VAVDQTAIVFPGTKFRTLIGDYDPLDVPDLPAKTVAYGGDWVDLGDLGYTKGGASLQVNRTIQDEYFDQDIDPVMQIVTQRDIRLRTVLGEATIAHMIDAFGFGTPSHHDSTTTIHGDDTLFINGQLPPLDDKSVGLEAAMRDGQPMRAILYRAQAVANVTLAFMKNTTVNVPFEARAMNDTTVDGGQVMRIQRVLPLLPV
jgi:hypothetical protein